MTLRAALFDFGGVFTASPFDAIESAAPELGAAPGQLLEIVFGPYDRDTDHPWHRVERGELSFMDARTEIMSLGRREGIESDPIKLFMRMADAPGVRAEMIEVVREVRAQGIKTALVTNNAVEFRDRWRRMIPVDDLFEVVIDSSEVGMRKPDPAIYHLALQRLGDVSPAEAVFLDDYHGNVRAAEALGIRGIVVEADPSGALSALRALLIQGSERR
jgi:putative hydrolase of the HAD superfamily